MTRTRLWYSTQATFVILALACAPRDKAPAAGGSGNSRALATIGAEGSRIEGIAEYAGKLYVADWKDGGVYRVDPANPSPTRVALLPTQQGQAILGAMADAAGNLYFAIPDSGLVLKVAAGRVGASDFSPTNDVSRFATGAFGANGIAFDKAGHLWISGGSEHALYHVGPNGGAAQLFAKDYSPVSSDTTMPVRVYSVNGVALDSKGNVYTVNTGSGAIDRLEVKPGYAAGVITNLVTDPRLIGADGLIIDAGDTLWISCNYRNALMKVSPAGEIAEVAANGAEGPLHFPAELKRIGSTIYLTNLNFPIGANTGRTDSSAAIVEVKVP